jgi:hypothetical protein
MARPGFVLEVDERTPPLVVPYGETFRLERLPLGTSVIYPPDSLPAVPDVREAIDAALDAPLGSAPLTERLQPGMRLTIVFDDLSTPVPTMRTPDVRGLVAEAVLTRAAAVGVDDVALVAARGLNRRMTPAELRRTLGERVFRSFQADGQLTNHDAEDPDRLRPVGSTDDGEVAINARVAESDLVVQVHLVTSAREPDGQALVTGLGSAATIGRIQGLAGLRSGGAALDAAAAQVLAAVPVFAVHAVLDNDAFPAPLAFLAKREWELSIREQAVWRGLRRGLTLTPPRLRRRWLGSAAAGYRPTLLVAGDPAAVHAAGAAQIASQQLVPVDRQADVGVIAVPHTTPYSVDSVTNPVLAAWSALAAAFGASTGRPFVREGGALICYHPLSPEFSPLHHPSYVDFFGDVLPGTTDPEQIAADVEPKFATDPWYRHLYRTGLAFAGVHPLYRWYELATVRQQVGDVVWVGADRGSVERLGFRAASTLADALEIVSSTVGRTPTISYLHTPPHLVADVA